MSAGAKRFFPGAGAATPVVVAIDLPNLPEVAPGLDAAEVKTAILDSQRHGQRYRDFTRRVMAARVHGYFAFLHSQRFTYFGRQPASLIFPASP